MMAWFSSLLACGLIVSGCAEAAPRVGLVNQEQPVAAGAPIGLENSRDEHHQHGPGGHDLPNDTQSIEPEHPASETKQERALVHIHAPNGVVCSGVVLGPRVIATAQQCLKGEPQGASALGAGRDYRVEVASSTLTWTIRRAKVAVIPQCGWDDVDIGLLVLDEPIPWVEPLKVTSAPGAGGRVQALGFGRCDGRQTNMKDRVGTVSSRVSEDIVVDIPLCKGDTGGPVVDGAEVIGIISHRDDPEGSPLRTTTISRLDTRAARKLLDQATKLADGGDIASAKPVACR